MGTFKYPCTFAHSMTDSLSLMKRTMLFQFCLISAFIVLSGCLNTGTSNNSDNTSQHNCMDISGIVLGRLHPGSHGNLYRMELLDFPAVMDDIREREPTASVFLSNNHNSFLHWLPQGKYILAIPVSSYNSSCGSPIPVERLQNDLSVRVIYKGGDSKYMISVFAIE
mgnify:CR=1 FL=1